MQNSLNGWSIHYFVNSTVFYHLKASTFMLKSIRVIYLSQYLNKFTIIPQYILFEYHDLY